MGYRKERDEFIARCAQEGVSEDTARALLRYSTTATRLAVASCNGDWPADNGERKVKACQKCGGGWVGHTILKGGCPDCRCEALIVKACVAAGLPYELSGDPRGCVVKVKLPSGRGNSWGGDGMTCVPAPYL